MLSGLNTDIEYKGKTYHVQTEDGGIDSPVIVSLLFDRGAILASKKTSYADIIKADCLEEIVRDLMREQHKGMLKDLVSGRVELAVPAEGAPSRAAPPSKRDDAAAPAEPAAETPPKRDVGLAKSLDEVILDYLTRKGDEGS